MAARPRRTLTRPRPVSSRARRQGSASTTLAALLMLGGAGAAVGLYQLGKERPVDIGLPATTLGSTTTARVTTSRVTVASSSVNPASTAATTVVAGARSVATAVTAAPATAATTAAPNTTVAPTQPTPASSVTTVAQTNTPPPTTPAPIVATTTLPPTQPPTTQPPTTQPPTTQAPTTQQSRPAIAAGPISVDITGRFRVQLSSPGSTRCQDRERWTISGPNNIVSDSGNVGWHCYDNAHVMGNTSYRLDSGDYTATLTLYANGRSVSTQTTFTVR